MSWKTIALLLLSTAMPVSEETDLLTAVLGKPITWAYGKHIVAGNVILMDDSPSDHRKLFVALGDGEWDGVETLWVNGQVFTDRTGLSDAAGYLFHPGKAGEVGTGGETGSQKVSRWFPAGVTQLNFSHTAYLALWVTRDVDAPGPDIDIRGIYRTRKLQEYDAAGTPTVFQWSANPSWEIADVLRVIFKVPVAKFDWASFVNEAAVCAAAVGGFNRYDGNVYFTTESGDQILDRLLMLCRGFLTEDSSGKIGLRIDTTRASVFDFSMANTVAGSFQYDSGETRKKANKFIGKFRDIANNYAEVQHEANRELHQEKVDKIIRAEIDAGNSRHGQVFRILNYLAARMVDVPGTARLRGMQDSFKLLPGDMVRVKNDVAPFPYASGVVDWKEFDVIEASDAAGDERDYLLQEYSANTYSEAEEASQAVENPTVAHRSAVAAHVTGQTASEGPSTTRDKQTVSTVTVSFTPPSPRKNWAGVDLYITGYRGGTQPILVHTGGESPMKFDLESTNETITIYFVSFNTAGVRRAILTSPSATALLDGQTSAPVAPSGFSATQFVIGKTVVNRVVWNENVEVDISHYEIARRTDATVPSITDVVASVPASGVSGEKGRWEDSPEATSYFYAVRAVNTTGLASAFTTPAQAQNTAPATPANFIGQAVAAKGHIVILTWDENTEADILHYEIARRADATAPGTADVIATVAAAGESATKKAQWEDAPGSATANYRYYVRAVDTLNQKSAFTAAASIRALAPDGTKDTGVPSLTATNLFSTWTRISVITLKLPTESYTKIYEPGAAQIVYSGTAPAESENAEGITVFETVLSIADSAGGVQSGTVTEEHPVGRVHALAGYTFVVRGPNRYMRTVTIRARNYFGWSAAVTIVDQTGSPDSQYLGSLNEDNKPPTSNYDPAVQDYGARTIIGRSTGDLEETTNSSSAKIHLKRNTTIKNAADATLSAILDAGSTVAQIIELIFADRATNEWLIRKTAANGLEIEEVGGQKRIELPAAGDNVYKLGAATGVGHEFRDSAATVLGVFDSDSADGETAVWVRRNVGGTLSLERVTMGAADSGGAGFKVLRVPN